MAKPVPEQETTRKSMKYQIELQGLIAINDTVVQRGGFKGRVDYYWSVKNQ